jgi:uncharacterized protein (DUF433 family)
MTEKKEAPFDIRFRPAYTAAEAARYLSIPAPTVSAWFRGIQAKNQTFKPVLRLEDPRDRRLSFTNLVEAHVLRALRTKHGVSMKAVREALDYVRREHGIERLLIDRRLRAVPGKMFLQRYGELVELTRSGQHVIERVWDSHLQAVVEDPAGVPLKLYPWIPDRTQPPRRSILIDPAVSFGRPMTASRGIATTVLADLYDAGTSIDELSLEYGLTPEEVEDALAFERAA